MIRIACIDDEKPFRDTIGKFIERYAKEKNLEYSIEFFDDGMDFMCKRHGFFPLLLVDVDMPEMDGMRLAAKVREQDEKCIIVFITNLQNYAIKGYEVNAFDYILKPLSYAVFCKKLDRIIPAALRNSDQSVILTVDFEKKKISINDIVYIELDGHKVIYHLLTQEIEQWCSMRATYEVLREHGFELCNSCYLVNMAHVVGISGDTVTVTGGKTLHMSRSRTKKLIDAFTSFSC